MKNRAGGRGPSRKQPRGRIHDPTPCSLANSTAATTSAATAGKTTWCGRVTMASARSLARFSSSRASSLKMRLGGIVFGVERARSIAGRCVVNALTEGETAARRQ